MTDTSKGLPGLPFLFAPSPSSRASDPHIVANVVATRGAAHTTMDNQYAASLVYPQPPDIPSAHPQNMNMSWNATQPSTSPPNSTSSTSSGHSYYPIQNTSPERVDFTQDYHASPAAQPAYLPHTFSQYPRALDAGPSNHAMPFASPQLESSIGPARNTRRRARADALRRGEEPSDASDQVYDQRSFVSTRFPMSTASGSPRLDGWLDPPMSHARSSSSSSNPRSTSPAMSLSSSHTSASAGSAPHSRSYLVPPAQYPSPPDATMERPKHSKKRLYSSTRRDICLFHMENPNLKQEQIATHFGVERSTVSKILKQKTKWLATSDDQTPQKARARPSKWPYLEMELESWLLACKGKPIVFTDNLIRTKALELAKEAKLTPEKFKASSGWIENFKHRHGIRRGVFYNDVPPKPIPYELNPHYQRPVPTPFTDPQLELLNQHEREHPVTAEVDDDGNVQQQWPSVVTDSPILRGAREGEEPVPSDPSFMLMQEKADPDGNAHALLQLNVGTVPEFAVPTDRELEDVVDRLIAYRNTNPDFFLEGESKLITNIKHRIVLLQQGIHVRDPLSVEGG